MTRHDVGRAVFPYRTPELLMNNNPEARKQELSNIDEVLAYLGTATFSLSQVYNALSHISPDIREHLEDGQQNLKEVQFQLLDLRDDLVKSFPIAKEPVASFKP